jgi:N-hydroxyarylamine O-acetyltransferase
MPMVNTSAYLDRIAYTGPSVPNADNLRAIHRAHLLTVPFENLDIGLGRKIVCDEDAFLRQIVDNKRGGFCYQMNGAFAALLRTLGFQVTLLSARVNREDGSPGPEFDHLALRVDLEEPWLADVGFGDSFVEPLRLRTGIEQAQGGRKFRIVDHGGALLMERDESDGIWRSQFSFKLQPRRLEDFASMCHYHQTSPESPFTRKRVCTKATLDGRITLSDSKLIFTRNGKKEEHAIGSEEEWQAALKKHFNITL